MGEGMSVPKKYFTMGIRAESMRLVPMDIAMLKGEVCLLEPRGPESVLTVKVGIEKIKAIVPSDVQLTDGEGVGLSVDGQSLIFFDGDTNRKTNLNLAGRLF